MWGSLLRLCHCMGCMILKFVLTNCYKAGGSMAWRLEMQD